MFGNEPAVLTRLRLAAECLNPALRSLVSALLVSPTKEPRRSPYRPNISIVGSDEGLVPSDASELPFDVC